MCFYFCGYNSSASYEYSYRQCNICLTLACRWRPEQGTRRRLEASQAWREWGLCHHRLCGFSSHNDQQHGFPWEMLGSYFGALYRKQNNMMTDKRFLPNKWSSASLTCLLLLLAKTTCSTAYTQDSYSEVCIYCSLDVLWSPGQLYDVKPCGRWVWFTAKWSQYKHVGLKKRNLRFFGKFGHRVIYSACLSAKTFPAETFASELLAKNI